LGFLCITFVPHPTKAFRANLQKGDGVAECCALQEDERINVLSLNRI
jgi:hypothetical protein